MTQEDLKSEIMGCLPSEYIKDSITAGRIANNILDVIKKHLKPDFENLWISVKDKLPADDKTMVEVKVLGTERTTSMFGYYVNYACKNEGATTLVPTHWRHLKISDQ